MRTTISVDEQVLKAAKAEARRHGQTLGEFIGKAIQRELARQRQPRLTPRPAIPVFTRGTGVRPGVDITSGRALAELLDEGMAIEELR